jgi:lipopolysaccharide heptosyltransferase II
MGDVLMTTPAVRALRESLPGVRLTLLTSPGGAEAARMVPELDQVIDYGAPWVKSTAPRPDSWADLEIARKLSNRRFDAAVIFTVFSQSPLPAALLCSIAGIPLRLARCPENPYLLLTDWLPEDEPEDGIRHEVRRQLDLVASIGAGTRHEALSLAVPADARTRIDALLQERGLDYEAPWCVLHPGATATSRRYPAASYAVAAHSLAVEEGCRVVLTGSDDERDLVESIAAAVPGAVALAGELDLAGLAALIERAPLLITNNTGPAHIAAALGTPVVDLYAGTNPQHTPWLTPSRVLTNPVPCAPCFRSVCPEGHHACLDDIAPEAVVQAARELLYAPLARGVPA